jgi:hypothetical protein
MFKKIILIFLFIFLLFWAPWLADDGGEKAVSILQQKDFYKQEMTELATSSCDGLYTVWVPFGRLVKYCDIESWYVVFWGKVF